MGEIRYFAIRADAIGDGEAVLAGEEFHHLVRVVRARKGAEIRLLDGRGTVYEAVVRDIGKDRAIVDIVSSIEHGHPPEIDIAISALKAPRLDLVIEKCTEIGLRRLIIFSSERSVRTFEAGKGTVKTERLQRKALAACKQSGQPYLPEVSLIADLGGLIDLFADYRSIFLADRGGARLIGEEASRPEVPALGIIGPEGGLTDAERAALVSGGAGIVSLGGHRLRSETAAICLLYALRSWRDASSCD
jgi:16S rRNA (uracil1498-N3)-methyltransferase